MPGYRALVNNTTSVASAEALSAMRELARTQGLFCGPSSGAHLIAARRVRAENPELRIVVTVLCDEGEKYLQDHFIHAPSDDAEIRFF